MGYRQGGRIKLSIYGTTPDPLDDYWADGAFFKACRGQYSGSIFLIASGPSANDFPIERYPHVPMMAMNGSIVRFGQTSSRPLVYLCDDLGFVKKRLPLVRQGLQLAERALLGRSALEALLSIAPDLAGCSTLHLMERVNRSVAGSVLSDRRYAWQMRNDPDIECGFSLWRKKPNRIGFSRNMSKGYFGGRTIPYAALQMAFHMGFSKVFLVGVDLDGQSGRCYEQGEQALQSRLDEDFDDYILPSFKILADRVVSTDFQVFNLSHCSKLPGELIPGIALDQLDALLAAS